MLNVRMQSALQVSTKREEGSESSPRGQSSSYRLSDATTDENIRKCCEVTNSSASVQGTCRSHSHFASHFAMWCTAVTDHGLVRHRSGSCTGHLVHNDWRTERGAFEGKTRSELLVWKCSGATVTPLTKGACSWPALYWRLGRSFFISVVTSITTGLWVKGMEYTLHK